MLRHNTVGNTEVFLANIGIVLLVPIFTPEQDKDIRDLAETKRTPPGDLFH
ncbi:hypothetical protein [Paenibacillus sp. TH7-28]